MVDVYLDAFLDRISLMIRRGIVFGDERDDVAYVLRILRIDASNPDNDHPLADLYRALRFTKDTEIVYLSREHAHHLDRLVQAFDR